MTVSLWYGGCYKSSITLGTLYLGKPSTNSIVRPCRTFSINSNSCMRSYNRLVPSFLTNKQWVHQLALIGQQANVMGCCTMMKFAHPPAPAHPGFLYRPPSKGTKGNDIGGA